ncbi:MAG: hypothetical protein D6690_15945 [Nitrospirae bacterium]|nr:MAG: hypothetical protein D6690_15945 [Nitrospirota bacterium]
MPPAIHPVDLVQVLRHKQLTPAIVFLTSRRACDEAIEAFERRAPVIAPERTEAIRTFLADLSKQFPSIAQHPLLPTVQHFAVAAHHAGHLPSWKIAVEELMRKGYLDAVFATTTLAAGVDFPARTVVITQSSVRKTRDFTDLTIGEIQQLAGRGGRRGKDLVGFVVVTPSPYIDLDVIAKGLTGYPEPIDSQFVVSYPMVLNLLKAYPLDQIEGILAKSFAQFQLNQRAAVHQEHLDAIHVKLAAYGTRECADWITQWQLFDLAKKRTSQRRLPRQPDSPEVAARLPFLTPGRVVKTSKGRAIVLRHYASRGKRQPMVSLFLEKGAIIECPVSHVSQIYDKIVDIEPAPHFPWCTPHSFERLVEQWEHLTARLQTLPIVIDQEATEDQELVNTLAEDFPCPTCPSRQACRRDHPAALRLRQKAQQLTKTVQALKTGLWHRFQERADILHHLGYLTPTFQLTAEGEWARLIRIDHSLLISELIRMGAFDAIEPALLAAVLASIAHDDDRPGSYLRMSPGLATMMHRVRAVAESLEPYEEPPLLRSDVAALTERWVGMPELTWPQLIRMTAMAEGDVYRLLARTLEYLSQIHTLKATHPSLADTAKIAIATMQRDVLKELP